MIQKNVFPKRYIHATNVHQGGGKVLLAYLLRSLDADKRYILNADIRMLVPNCTNGNVAINYCKNTLLSRLSYEFKLFREAKNIDFVLCFGNLPPLFKLKSHTCVFMQNRFLVDDVKLTGFNLISRVRIAFERIWFRFAANHANKYIVQTTTMKRLLSLKIGNEIPIEILPFSETPTQSYDAINDQPKSLPNNFIYVASGEPHKNHVNLIRAWCMLSIDGFRPNLYLTLDKTVFHELCTWIEVNKNEYNLRINNLGVIDACEMFGLYKKMDALIYPSTFESFGLPIVEAKRSGLLILAPELDYVRDIVNPDEVFDPLSPMSIARSVHRLLGHADSLNSLHTAYDFASISFRR